MANRATDYAIYLRKSRRDLDLEAAGQGETLARHRAALLDLADRQGLHIGRIYEEIVSGEMIAARPQMQQLLEDVLDGRWRGVLVMEVERLARGNTRDQGEVAEAFTLSGTLIVTPIKTYDPTDEFDEEYFEFGLYMSRREYKTIRRRMQRGIDASVQAGNYLSAYAPFGYDVVQTPDGHRSLAPNDKAAYVRLIYTWTVRDHLTTGEIARRLTDMGVRTPRGNPEWASSSVRGILQNEAYYGAVRWGRKKSTRVRSEQGGIKVATRVQLPGDYRVIRNAHPAIIDEATFQAAQECFSGAVPVKALTTLINPLAGILFCKHCGRSMIMQAVQREEQFRYLHPASKFCHVKSLPYRQVLDALAGALLAYIGDFKIRSDNSSLLEEQQNRDNLRLDMQRSLQALEARRARLFELLEDGTYSRADFTERREALLAQKEQLQAALTALDNSPVIDYAERVSTFSEVLHSLQDPEIDTRHKNQLLKGILDRVDYDVIDYGRGHGGRVKLDLYLKI